MLAEHPGGATISADDVPPDLTGRRTVRTVTLDGQDVLAMYDVTQRAIEHCKSGEGPFFIEAMTYRYRGHSMADPETYRDKDEIEEQRGEDPIVLFKDRLLKAEKVEESVFESIDSEIEELLDEAVEFAEGLIRRFRRAKGKGFLGVRAVLKQSIYDAPRTPAPKRVLSPRVASRNKWRRIEVLSRMLRLLADVADVARSRRQREALQENVRLVSIGSVMREFASCP